MKRIAFTLVALTAGCAAIDTDPEASPSGFAQQIAPVDAARIVRLVNYPGTTADVLDRKAGLDGRAAKNIVAARNGADGICPSADDRPFADLAAIDAVPYVGDAAFAKLSAWSLAHPAPAPETVEGVAFAGWESESVVWGVNHADLPTLDGMMDARAAKAIFAGIPFTQVAGMGPLPYVGATVLGKLHGEAGAWWQAMHNTAIPGIGGTFDGVDFDEAAAHTALAIANQATVGELTAAKITSTAAGKIVAARPYNILAQVAAVSGVGPSTMAALHAYAVSGTWSGASCVNAFDDAVGPHLGDLLFLSESDRPYDLVSFPGQGSTAPTAQSIAALLNVAGDHTVEVRPTSNWNDAYEPSGGTADPNAAALVEAAFAAQLTDVIYVAIHPPLGGIDQAEIQVYLLGRTSCGDLVGLHAVAIET